MSEPSWTDELEKYQRVATGIEPAAVVTTKDALTWRIVWGLGVALTLGAFALANPMRRFLEDFGTTLAFWLGFPRRLRSLNLRFLRHECRHVTQFVLFGWAVPVLGWFLGRRVRALAGVLPMGVVYALLPLPAGLALGRYLLEADAEETAWRACLRDGTLTPEAVLARAESFGALLAGPAYLYAWPWAKRCLRARAARVIRTTARTGAISRPRPWE
jgi:hypothetical protein